MKTKILLLIAILGMFSVSQAQQNDRWKNWEWLMGEWTGEGSGKPGDGNGTFSFTAGLDGNILTRKSHSEYPQKENKPPAIHEDLLIVYSDYSGNPGYAIYFDNEGHIINYTITYSEKSIIFLSEKIQNAPLFRLTYTQLDYDSVNTKFEISKDGEKFTTYIEGKSKKAK